jgi:hypothetical protein
MWENKFYVTVALFKMCVSIQYSYLDENILKAVTVRIMSQLLHYSVTGLEKWIYGMRI